MNDKDALMALADKWEQEIADYDGRPEDHDPEDWMSGHLECLAELREALAEQPAEGGRTEDHSFPPTSRRERAVATLLADGWKWDGTAWTRPPAEDDGAVDDAMVERALAAYAQSRGTYEGEGPTDADDMRAALTAALAETTSQIEKLTQEVGRMAEALWAFPAEPNPYTYRTAHAKARAALAQQEPRHD